MEFRLLGPLEVLDAGASVPVGGGKRRSLLALLLVHTNEVVSAERLIDELWGERPPPTVAKSLHVHVSQLRRELGHGGAAANGDVLLTRGGGYVVRVGPDDLDIRCFEHLVAEGRRALESGDPAEAAKRLRRALALWRGPPLADFAYEPFAQPEIARLEEQRLVALEDRVEADLALARHAELVGELEALVREHPLRERPRAQLMLALYRSGRQAEALRTYRDGRALLVSELGLEPGPDLRSLEKAILEQSPELAPPRAPPVAPPAEPRQPDAPAPAAAARARAPRRPRPVTLLILGGAVLAGAATYAAVFRAGGDSDPGTPAADVAGNSIAAVDGTSGVAKLALPLIGRPTDLAAGDGMLWATTVDSASLTAVDAGTRAITRAVPFRLAPSAVGVGAGMVWVADGGRGELVAVRAGYDDVSAPIRFRRGPHPPRRRSAEATSIAVGAGGVWVTDGSARLARVDPVTHRVISIRAGRPLDGVTIAAGAVWAISARAPSVLRIDPGTNAVTDRLPIVARAGEEAPSPVGIAASRNAVWVLNANTATVTRIDPGARGIVSTIAIGVDRVPNEIAAGGRAAWVANEDGTLSRIDEGASTARSVWVGESVREVAVDGARVWVGKVALDELLPGGAG